MQFLITAHDGKDMLDARMRVRPRHLENIAGVKGSVVCAGGILDGEGRPVGSVLIMDFASRKLLEEYLAGEPYVTENVWADVRVEPMNVVIVNGEMVGK